MKIVCGPVKQVQISSQQKTEGAGDNKKQVTYHTHKFLVGDKAYRYKRSGEPLNISDGNTVAVALTLFNNVGKIYNQTTDEYSHPNPFVLFIVSLLLIALTYVSWTMYFADIVRPFAPENIFDLIGIFGYGAIVIVAWADFKNFATYNALKSAQSET